MAGNDVRLTGAGLLAVAVVLAVVFSGNGDGGGNPVTLTTKKPDDKHYVRVYFAYRPRPVSRPGSTLVVLINGDRVRPKGINKAGRVRPTDNWLGVWNTFGPYDEIRSVQATIYTLETDGQGPRPVTCRIYLDDATRPVDQSPPDAQGTAPCQYPSVR